MKASEFDNLFDEGASVMPYADLSKATRPNRKTQKVNVDFPTWMVNSLDREAAHLGISRQALVKVWIANCLARDSHSMRQHDALAGSGEATANNLR